MNKHTLLTTSLFLFVFCAQAMEQKTSAIPRQFSKEELYADTTADKTAYKQYIWSEAKPVLVSAVIAAGGAYCGNWALVVTALAGTYGALRASRIGFALNGYFDEKSRLRKIDSTSDLAQLSKKERRSLLSQ